MAQRSLVKLELRDRNDTSHTYDEAKAIAVYESIKANMPAMRSAIARLRASE